MRSERAGRRPGAHPGPRPDPGAVAGADRARHPRVARGRRVRAPALHVAGDAGPRGQRPPGGAGPGRPGPGRRAVRPGPPQRRRRRRGRDARVRPERAHGARLELRRLASGPDDGPAERRDDLGGRYRLLDELGDGATAIVYRALHLALDREVALKLLRPTEARDPRAVARFLREARVASRFRHANVIEILDYGQLPDGRPFLAMELSPWPTLDRRLADGPLPIDDAVEITRQLAAGLGAAHAAGVVHRDLKPSNVFVSDALQVKIGDFGAAKLVGSPGLTQEGWTVGTPLYMAPEQIVDGPSDHRLDLYALGCILFEMLTGHPPYQAPTVRELLTRHLSAPLPALTDDAPPALAAVVRKALAKAPDDRHQSAAELAAGLAAALRTRGGGGWRRWLPRKPTNGE
ncbi:MAG: serine/threonine protein kinase [Myxococcales bacterium]|nr:serine/threonine protein kinase [Myxococcales bacterium]